MFSGTVKRLHAFWRDRFHPAASREQVAIAFALLAGGLVLSVLGVLVAVVGDLMFPRTSIFADPNWMRELGIAAAATGLPLFLLGLVAALPGRLWLRITASTGAVLAAVGVGLFVWLYPEQWARSVQGPNGLAIGAYLAGAAMLSAGAAASVGNYFVQRATGDRRERDPTDRPVSDEEIAADLAWAEGEGWSWGGVRTGGPGTKILLKESVEPVRFGGRGKRVHLAGRESSEPEVKAAKALSNLRGIKTPEQDSMVGDQVDHLRRLKAQKAAERDDRSWWQRLWPFGN